MLSNSLMLFTPLSPNPTMRYLKPKLRMTTLGTLFLFISKLLTCSSGSLPTGLFLDPIVWCKVSVFIHSDSSTRKARAHLSSTTGFLISAFILLCGMRLSRLPDRTRTSIEGISGTQSKSGHTPSGNWAYNWSQRKMNTSLTSISLTQPRSVLVGWAALNRACWFFI